MTDDKLEAVEVERNLECECAEVYEHLFEYLDSEMTHDDLLRIRTHVAGCGPCSSELSVEELFRSVLRRACVERAPEELRIKIMERLRTGGIDLITEHSFTLEIE